MTIFFEDDLAEAPVLQRWSIFVGEQGRPFVTGQHSFHEGVRTAIDEVLVELNLFFGMTSSFPSSFSHNAWSKKARSGHKHDPNRYSF